MKELVIEAKTENLDHVLAFVDEELEKYLRKEECYEKVLNEALEYSLMAGGKRLRAILVIEAYKLFQEDYEKCLPFSMALEMVHNFSLIHDDLPEIDNDDFRHGKPTNHKKFNHATALLAGDYLFNNAYMVIGQELLRVSNSGDQADLANKIRAFHEFSHAVDRMIAGEYLDTELEGQQIPLELLQYIHHNKTAELLKIALRMGAIIAGASEEDIENLSQYADRIGLAFQVKDDILSEEGNQEILGKPTGNDKEHQKCTYVSYYGLEGAKKELERLTQEALNYLEAYGEKGEFLKELTIYLQQREK